VECVKKSTGQKFALKVLKDNAKSRREIDLHWRASSCKHIVNIEAVYENTHNNHKCLLVKTPLQTSSSSLTLPASKLGCSSLASLLDPSVVFESKART
jgi:hypothetical protein